MATANHSARAMVPLQLLGLVLVVVAALMSQTSTAQSATCYAPSALNFTSAQGALWLNGQPFKLKGTSWFGFETGNKVVHGLWTSRSYLNLLDFLATNNFNAIRIPFYLDLVLNDAQPSSINYGANPDLQGLSSMQVMDKVVQAAAARGLLIMFDLHSFLPDTNIQDNTWYNGANPESKVISGWTKLLQRYKDQWNVFAADIKNEPYAATWGTGNTGTDWNLAVARIADAIAASVSSRFLIFVEGVASSPACTDACFWGENLIGVRTHPVQLRNPSKLVYSPHVYGPSVYGQPYFSVGNFPANMPAIWDTHFGFIPSTTGSAVVIGEWGGHYTGSNQVWLEAMGNYLLSKRMTDQFFWCLNPNSGDTGGLLQNDWTTPEQSKLTLLAKVVPAPTKFTTNANGQVCVSGGSAPAVSASASPKAAVSASASPKAGVSASPSPKAPAASASPSPKPSGGSNQFSFCCGSSVWWMAVTIPGSSSVRIDCGNGQGWQNMVAGWEQYVWTFASGNGQPCSTTLKFQVNGGATQTVQATF
ncbi:cellulase (glycosyl hydrolase family 5) subfamily protein [Acanthamoeba castellanii str. Neff]|uniref:Cellulase (Glycosyl hydrolase family 5) subfamily protein n=1 Tax=Acanthamoeba castellanii (strain ATCC 30010 / Neff) TaxID=1257118 RepID=L8HAJ9_ACACF|nr:cellulase (glycosyl hydrolase family 5) subfamily protein [Acanthamoeba castellanii str. Neff]ELR21743.1 cellulase (glycosyl hydrolase family 5) subfamily protein [Acanthamoeba castellanii str. Neff]